MIFGISGFACYFRVRRQLPAFENALVVILLRLVTKNDDNAADGINTFVVVVMVFGSSNAVSSKDDRSAGVEFEEKLMGA